MKKKRFLKMLFWGIIGVVAINLFIILVCNLKIEIIANQYVSYNLDKMPNKKVALVLGTAERLKNGNKNYFFKYRMDAAYELYKAGKVKYFIVSGDNSSKNYNEPEDMQQALIRRGVPEEIIFLDFAGFRTLDSIIRAKKIFGQNEFIIVSQQFHNERAVYLARYFDIDAYGYNAKTLSLKAGFKTYVREKLARVKVFIDILTDKQPRFLGEPVVIP